MSRTLRRKNPRVSWLRRMPKKRVPDGTPQHVSGGCSNHGGCAWCVSNRTIAVQRQAAASEVSA